MGLIRAAAILAIDNRFRTPSVELKCLGTSFGGAKQKFQHGRHVIKAHKHNLHPRSLLKIRLNIFVH